MNEKVTLTPENVAEGINTLLDERDALRKEVERLQRQDRVAEDLLGDASQRIRKATTRADIAEADLKEVMGAAEKMAAVIAPTWPVKWKDGIDLGATVEEVLAKYGINRAEPEKGENK